MPPQRHGVKCGSCGGYHSNSEIVKRCYADKHLAETVGSHRPDTHILPNAVYRLLLNAGDKGAAYANVAVFSFSSGRWQDRYFVSLIDDSGNLEPITESADRDYLVSRIFEEGWTGCIVQYSEKSGNCGACGETLYEDGTDETLHNPMECIMSLFSQMRAKTRKGIF